MVDPRDRLVVVLLEVGHVLLENGELGRVETKCRGLDEQAFLQAARGDTDGIEVLDHLQHERRVVWM